MKNCLTAMAVLLLTAGAAQAQMFDDSFASVLGGWSYHPHLTLGATQPGVSDSYNVGARIGTALPMLPGFTVDADYFYNRGGFGNGGSLNSQSAMGDLIYHVPADFIPVPLPFHLYGGGGLGVVNDSLGGTLHGSSTVMGWQAIGGAEFPISDTTSMFAEYRYQNAHDANAGVIKGVGNTSDNVSVGVKYHF
jgi:opacity protein-like surface antigen